MKPIPELPEPTPKQYRSILKGYGCGVWTSEEDIKASVESVIGQAEQLEKAEALLDTFRKALQEIAEDIGDYYGAGYAMIALEALEEEDK